MYLEPLYEYTLWPGLSQLPILGELGPQSLFSLGAAFLCQSEHDGGKVLLIVPVTISGLCAIVTACTLLNVPALAVASVAFVVELLREVKENHWGNV